MSECASYVPRQASNDLCLYLTALQREGIATVPFDPKTAAAMLMGAIFADAMGRDMMPDVYPQPAANDICYPGKPLIFSFFKVKAECKVQKIFN